MTVTNQLRKNDCMLNEALRVVSLAKRDAALMPPPAPSKPALSEEELEKKSTAIVEEYLHINDLKVYNASFNSVFTPRAVKKWQKL